MDSINLREAEITKISDSPRAKAALEKHLEEMIEGPAFKGSHRSVLFLRHVVTQAVAGNFESLKERAIGMELFGRSPSYVTGEDAIVRVTANDVRKRLVQHYDRFGTAADFRINLPPGSYIPEIISEYQSEPGSLDIPKLHEEPASAATETKAHQNSEFASSVAQIPLSGTPPISAIESTRPKDPSQWKWLSFTNLLVVLNLMLFGILLYGVVWMRSWRNDIAQAPASRAATVSVLPSSAFFSSPNPTHLITSDPDIYWIRKITGTPISVAEYANHIYVPEGIALTSEMKQVFQGPLRGDKAASTDSQFAADVAALAESDSRKIEVQGARSLQFLNLKTDDNFIFLGSPRSDPWVSLFDNQLDFQFFLDKAGLEDIRNVRSRTGEQPVYAPVDRGEASWQSYAIVAFVRNPDQHGQILLLAGISGEGTQAAGRLVTDLPRLSMELRKCGLTTPSPVRHFEFLLSVSEMAGSPIEANVQACHILP